MKAIILAAGRGSRMGALTDSRPKCLAMLGGRTLLERALHSLAEGGCSEIGVVTGYRSDLIAPFVRQTFHNGAWAQTNMVASLAAADEWLAAEPVIVSYSDIFFTADTVARLRTAKASLAITYDRDWQALWTRRFESPLADAETFKLDAKGHVIEIGGRASSLEEIEGQYMGLSKITPSSWRDIKAALGALPAERRERLDMTGLYALLISRGVAITAIAQGGPWGECDSASDLALYEGWLADGRLVY